MKKVSLFAFLVMTILLSLNMKCHVNPHDKKNEQNKLHEADNQSCSELIMASGNGRLARVKELLDHGVSPDCDCGSDCGDGDILNEFDTALMRAARNGHLPVVKLLVSRGAAVNMQGYECPLGAAVTGHHLCIVKYLVSKGADVNLRFDADSGPTVLMGAAFNGNLEIVEYLVSKGAKVKDISRDRNHSTLSNALEGKNYKIAEFLISKGADVNFKTGTGETLIIRCVKAKDTDAVRILIDAVADPFLKDDKGRSALDYVKEDKLDAVIEIIEKVKIHKRN